MKPKLEKTENLNQSYVVYVFYYYWTFCINIDKLFSVYYFGKLNKIELMYSFEYTVISKVSRDTVRVMTSAGQPRPTVVSKVIVAVSWSKVILVKVCPQMMSVHIAVGKMQQMDMEEPIRCFYSQ